MKLARTRSSTKNPMIERTVSDSHCGYRRNTSNADAATLQMAKDCSPIYLDSHVEEIPEKDGFSTPIWPSVHPKLKIGLAKKLSLDTGILHLKPHLSYTKPIRNEGSDEDIDSGGERSMDSLNTPIQDSSKAYPYYLPMDSLGDHSITFSSLPHSSTPKEKKVAALFRTSKFNKQSNTIQSPAINDERLSEASFRKQGHDLDLRSRRDAVPRTDLFAGSTTEPLLLKDSSVGDKIDFSDWKKKRQNNRDNTQPVRLSSILSPKSSLKSDDSRSPHTKKKVHFSKKNLVLVYKN